MKAYSFIYDDIALHDLGYVICSFDSNGVETIGGAEIIFNTVSTQNGLIHELTSVGFNEPLTATFQICKNLCNGTSMEISLEEWRDLARWLCRNEFHKFGLIDRDSEYSNIYFMASFNINKIEIGGRLVGVELNMQTNSPFAKGRDVIQNFENVKALEPKTFVSKSDQEGHVFPNMIITIKQAGDLELVNSAEPNRKMVINGCSVGEVIEINYPLINTNLNSHRISNNFNWCFYRIVTKFKDRMNSLVSNLDCNIQLSYQPVIKVGI